MKRLLLFPILLINLLIFGACTVIGTPTQEVAEVGLSVEIVSAKEGEILDVNPGEKVILRAEAIPVDAILQWQLTGSGALSNYEEPSIQYEAPQVVIGEEEVLVSVTITDPKTSRKANDYIVFRLLPPTPTPIPPTRTPTPVSDAPLTLSTPTTIANAIRVDQTPEIDGLLNDPAWSQAQPFTYAVHPLVNDSTTITVRLLWDDKYLYASFEVSDTQVEDASPEAIWDGDSVGVIIENGGQVQEYRYTMRGDNNDRSRLDADRAGTTTSESSFKGTTTLNKPDDQDEGYTVEMSIPWATPPTVGSTVAADLWSIDHDYKPGEKYNAPGVIFSKISWDGDQNVTTARRSILLSDSSLAAPDATADGTGTRPILAANGSPLLVTFTSGVGQETGRQEIPISALKPGRYSLVLQNASPEHSGTWLIWDYLALKSGQNLVWEIGDAETPADYSPQASDEFCDNPEPGGGCIGEFTVGATTVADFMKELNDWSFMTEKINFEITEEQANADLTLVLSTLYSSHEGAAHFNMQLKLEEEPCSRVQITMPQGTKNKQDAGKFPVSNQVVVTWEPADCVMIVQFYQNNEVQQEYKNVVSGTELDIGEPGSGETEIKLWREGFTQPSNSTWVWIQ